MTGIIMSVYGAVVAPPPPPPPPPAECTTQSAYVTSISPSSGVGNSSATIYGYFPVNSFNGQRVTNVSVGGFNTSFGQASGTAESQITITIPNLSPGTYVVQVFNGCTPLMNTVNFTITSAPPPGPPPPTTPPPTTPPPTGPGGCPSGTCPWYGTTCTASDAYWTGCAQGSCDIFNSGATCVILCAAEFC